MAIPNRDLQEFTAANDVGGRPGEAFPGLHEDLNREMLRYGGFDDRGNGNGANLFGNGGFAPVPPSEENIATLMVSLSMCDNAKCF